jgi:hypothetical protein
MRVTTAATVLVVLSSCASSTLHRRAPAQHELSSVTLIELHDGQQIDDVRAVTYTKNVERPQLAVFSRTGSLSLVDPAGVARVERRSALPESWRGAIGGGSIGLAMGMSLLMFDSAELSTGKKFEIIAVNTAFLAGIGGLIGWLINDSPTHIYVYPENNRTD